jgi:hypothetical protein
VAFFLSRTDDEEADNQIPSEDKEKNMKDLFSPRLDYVCY